MVTRFIANGALPSRSLPKLGRDVFDFHIGLLFYNSTPCSESDDPNTEYST
jgi:hypothetical protein